MLRNRPAADELADIQLEISALEVRQKALREVLLNDPDSRVGVTHEAVIERQRSEVFRRDRLPGYVARDPAFWEKKVSHKVILRERHGASAVNDRHQGRGVRPGDPISRNDRSETFQLIAEERDGFDVLETYGH